MKIFLFIVIAIRIIDSLKKIIFFNEFLKAENENLKKIKIYYKANDKIMFISFMLISMMTYIIYFLYNFYVINNVISHFLISIFNVLLMIDMSNFTFHAVKSLKLIKNNSNYLINNKFLLFSLLINLIFNMFMLYIFLFEVL